MKQCRYIFYLLILCWIGQGCSSRAVREAEAVVAEADSLWHAGKTYGMDAGDSATLAQAYETLKEHSAFSRQLSEVCPFVPCTSLLRTYSHACYHYGKLLRAKDDPEEAMRCFINATHSRTRDYHILGRVYSNMGSICHLAGEFQLSYDMYEKSADMFLQDGDTLLYYYGLNNMAYELAEQGKKEETLFLLDSILQNNTNSDLLDKAWETKAEMYRIVERYDSAIYCANKIKVHDTNLSLYYIIKAQAFYRLNISDSSLIYAKYVLADSLAHYENKFNAIYIISSIDSTLNKEDIRQLASQREDIRYYDYEPRKEKLINSVQILHTYSKQGKNWTWLYAIIATAVLTGSLFTWRHMVRRRQMRLQVKQLKEKQTDSILQSIKKHIDTTDINRTLHWKNYTQMKADADLYIGGIVSKLETYNLNETEIRFCILTMLDFTLAHIAETIYYSYPSAIKTLKKRTSDKLGTKPTELRNFLFDLASNA